MSNVVRAFVEGLLERGADIVLLVDARDRRVGIPSSIRRFGGRLPMHLKKEYPMDLEVDALGVRATLAFQGHTERCFFPWEAIWAAFDAGTYNGIGTSKEEPPAPEDPWQPPGPGLKKVHPFRVIKGGQA